MKKLSTLILLSLLTTTAVLATTYTFTGNGLFTNASLWAPSFPGYTLDSADEMIITEGSYCEIPSGPLFIAHGTVVNDGVFVMYNAVIFQEDGIWVNNGEMETHATYYINGAFTNNGTITINSTLAVLSLDGFFDNSNGVMITNAVFMDEQLGVETGTFKGNGSIVFAFENNGILAPGMSPGIFHFDWHFTQVATGTIEIELAGEGGAGSVNGHDKVLVDNIATLDGTLKVVLLDGYNPPIGTEFTIMEYGSRVGTFTTLDLPGGPGSWVVSYNATDITIEVIGALPVELTTFTAELENEETLLSWTTASELNNEGFEIQRSMDARSWEKIGWIKGAQNSQLEKQYNYIDRKPEVEMNYYRLKQLDFDGEFEYSDLVNVELRKKGILILIPNPSLHYRELSFTIQQPASEVFLQIYDSRGKEVYREDLGAKSKGNHEVKLQEKFPPGIYTITIQQKEEVEFVKMMVH